MCMIEHLILVLHFRGTILIVNHCSIDTRVCNVSERKIEKKIFFHSMKASQNSLCVTEPGIAWVIVNSD